MVSGRRNLLLRKKSNTFPGQVSGEFNVGRNLLLRKSSNTFVSFICAFFVYFMIYETKGLSLEQYALESVLVLFCPS